MRERPLPQDPEAEASLLATCAAPGGDQAFAGVILGLRAEDFMVPRHRAVFRALKAMVEAQVEVNPLTLKDALEQAGDLRLVGGYVGLTELLAAQEVGRPQVLADLLRRKAQFRQLHRLGASLAKQAASEAEAPKHLVDTLAGDLFRLEEAGGAGRGLQALQDVAGDAMARLEGNRGGGVRVGLPTLDALTQGFQPGNLVVLAARPGIGKTALALNWVLRAAAGFGTCGAFFSLEMSREEVFLRLLGSQSGVDLKRVQAGHATEAERERLDACRREILRMPLLISDQAAITVPQILNQVRQHAVRGNPRIELLVVDYLQLLSSPEASRAARQSEASRIGEISRGLKLLAKELEIPVVVLSQLNREVEHRAGGRPQLSDLRDSGAIEQDADIVAFIHRPLGGGQADTAELIVAKHRNGPILSIPLYFQAEVATYWELQREIAPSKSAQRRHG